MTWQSAVAFSLVFGRQSIVLAYVNLFTDPNLIDIYLFMRFSSSELLEFL